MKGVYTSANERAAIIGFWRSGATNEEISIIFPYLLPKSIKNIIRNYNRKLRVKQ